MIELIYKIMVKENNKFRTLYHGINRSKYVPMDKWLKAEKKFVYDGSGGKVYLSGFHCFKSLLIALEYFEKYNWGRGDSKVVVKCLGRNLRQKPTNKDIYLADEMCITSGLVMCFDQ